MKIFLNRRLPAQKRSFIMVQWRKMHTMSFVFVALNPHFGQALTPELVEYFVLLRELDLTFYGREECPGSIRHGQTTERN